MASGAHTMNRMCVPNIILNSALRKYNSMFNIAHINGCSIFSKLDELKKIISNTPLHALGVSETWFNKSHDGMELHLPGYKLLRCDRESPDKERGGGVALYIKQNIKSTIIFKSPTSGVDILLVELCLKPNTILIAVIYKPPDIYGFREIENILNQYHSLYDDILILGDLNINALDLNDSVTKSFKRFLEALSLHVVNSEPTHFGGSEPSLIDYIITNKLSKILCCNQVDVPGISKHDLIFCSYKVNCPTRYAQSSSFRSFKDLNMDALSNEILALNWDLIYCLPNVNDQVELFNEYVSYLYDKHVPLQRTRLKNQNDNPWFDEEVVICTIERDLAYRHWKNTKLESDYALYKRLRNLTTTKIRYKKQKFFDKMFPPKLSTKELWKKLHLLGVHDSNSIATTQINPNDFNSYFSKFSSKNTSSNIQLNISDKQFAFSSFSFNSVSSSEVFNAINLIKSNAIGLDNVSLKFIKVIYPYIASVLTHIFNHAITTSTFPNVWKKAKIIPVPKISYPIGTSDFRPISILSVLSKAFENILKKQITEYIDEHDLLDEYQSGFRKHHGTIPALLKISNDLFENMEEKKITALVLLDFTKAFDTVPHAYLTDKMSKLFNFSETAVSLIRSYLSGRSQSVFSNNAYSDTTPVSNGIPQGSILAPLFFSLFINDLPSALRRAKYHLFADDFQIYMPFEPENINDGIAETNAEVKSILDWSCANGLIINEDKTKFMLVKHQNISLPATPSIMVNGSAVTCSESVNDLGLIINHNLRWEDNTSKICSKVYFILRKLWRVAHILPGHVRHQLFSSLLLPHFTYGSPVFSNLNYECSHKLKMAFNACVRFVYLLKKYDHISGFSNLLLEVHISTHLDILSLVFLFKLLKYKTPNYLYSIIHSCRSSRTLNLKIPQYHYLATGNSFFVHAIKLWNMIPTSIKKNCTVDGFKRGCLAYFRDRN